MPTDVVVLAALVILIAVHEAGHALVAILLGVPVSSIVIGVPIRKLSFKLKSGNVSIFLNPFLLGGGVSLKNFDEVTQWKRILIAFAGPLINVLTCVIILGVLQGSLLEGIGSTWDISQQAAPQQGTAMVTGPETNSFDALNGERPLTVFWKLSFWRILVDMIGTFGAGMHPALLTAICVAIFGLWIGLFNLIPIPGTDGWHILYGFMSVLIPKAWESFITKLVNGLTGGTLYFLFGISFLWYLKELIINTGIWGISITTVLCATAWIINRGEKLTLEG